jgi:hypothetical protein
MTDPDDHEASAVQPPPDTGVSQPAPVVAWAEATTAGGPGTSGSRRVLDVVIWVVALIALTFLSLVRAGTSGTTGSERVGYVIGGVLVALLISAAARWLWLRARRRGDPTAQFVSPWIPIGALIVAVLSLFGGSRS